MQASSYSQNNSISTSQISSVGTPFNYQPTTAQPWDQYQTLGTAVFPQPTAPQTQQEQKQTPLKLEELERFQKLAPDEKYVFIIEQGAEDPKTAIKLLALWLKTIDQKKTA